MLVFTLKSEVVMQFTREAPPGTWMGSYLCPPIWVDFFSKASLLHNCFKWKIQCRLWKYFDRITVYIFAVQFHWIFVQFSSLIENSSLKARRLSGTTITLVIKITDMQTYSLFSYSVFFFMTNLYICVQLRHIRDFKHLCEQYSAWVRQHQIGSSQEHAIGRSQGKDF